MNEEKQQQQRPQPEQDSSNDDTGYPTTEPIRTGRSRWGRRSHSASRSQRSQRSQSRPSRTQSPALHRYASHIDDHGGYAHEHVAGHDDSDDESVEGAVDGTSEDESPTGSDKASEEKDTADEVPTTEKGLADREDVEAQRAPLERKTTSRSKKEKDPNLVTWDGPDDPENPKNWSTKRKWAATFVVSSFTFISPVASSMVAPALTTIAADFGITDEVESQLVLSIFILAYAIGPLFLGPLSELFGRRIVIQLSNVFFFAFNLACGFAQNKGQMIAFRFMAGLGGSAPLSIGGGVLGDCWQAHERGRAIAVYSLMPLIGPAVGKHGMHHRIQAHG